MASDLVIFPNFGFPNFISGTTAALETFVLSTVKVKFDMYDSALKQGRMDEQQQQPQEEKEENRVVDEQPEEVVEKQGEAVVVENVLEGGEEEEEVEEEEEEVEENGVRTKAKYSPSVIYNKIIENCNIISSRILNDRMRSYAEGNSPSPFCTSYALLFYRLLFLTTRYTWRTASAKASLCSIQILGYESFSEWWPS
jgi:hypothetical protein